LAIGAVGNAQTVDDRPNILFIVADDMGFTDLGSFGSEIETPTLDELAFEGVRLSGLHAANQCQATRVMLMASTSVASALELRPPLPSGDRDNRLSLDWAILPVLLQDAGYRTYMTGKWDLGMSGAYTPAQRGFDRSFAMLSASASHTAEYFRSDMIVFADDGVGVHVDDLPDGFYSTRAYTDKMLEYLGAHEAGAPWFAYLPYTAPHWPLQVPDDWLDRYAGRYDAGYDVLREERLARARDLGVLPPGAQPEEFEPLARPWTSLSAEEQQEHARAQEIYASMLTYMDASIGRVVDYLEASGQLDNTIIFFMSDHGASVSGIRRRFPNGLAGSNNSLENFGRMGSFIDHGRGFGEAASAPFRYFKGTLSEGGLRAAAFVRYPESIASGGVSHEFVTVMDILPTFLEIAGRAHPGAGAFRGRQINGIRGRSMWSHLTGEMTTVHSATDTAGWTLRDAGALVRGRHKIINEPSPDSEGVNRTPWRLYDLVSDPGEARDVAAQFPDVTAELVEEWETHWR
jgi:arylsulfatase